MQHITIYGQHAVAAVAQVRPKDILSIAMLQSNQDRYAGLLKKLPHVPVKTYTDRTALDELAEGGVHQGIVATCRPAEMLTQQWLKAQLKQLPDNALFLLLDGVQDPHNLGACLRTAAAAGVHAVIIPKDRAVGLTPVVRKVSVGASEVMPLVQVTNLARTMSELRKAGVWLYGLAGEAKQTLYQEKFAGATGIVMGAEGTGMRRLTREQCDGLVKIPMYGAQSNADQQLQSNSSSAKQQDGLNTGVESEAVLDSLNVSVATGIALFEVQRQR